MRERRYLFFSGKGSTHSPMGCEVNNEQYLGEAVGKHADEAYKAMVKEYPDILSEGFTFDNCRWEEVETEDIKKLRRLLLDTLRTLEPNSTTGVLTALDALDKFRQEYTGAYTVTTVSEDDLYNQGYDIRTGMDANIMFALASDMQENCTTHNFWECLDAACTNRLVETRDEAIRGRYLRFQKNVGEYPTLAHVTIVHVNSDEEERVLVGIGSSDEYTEEQDAQVYFTFGTIDELIEATQVSFADNMIIVNVSSVEFDKW